MTDQSQYDFSLKPTQELYRNLQVAYEFFNAKLFENKLPNCVITLQRNKNSYGYFSGSRFQRDNGVSSDEISLNPSHFKDRLPVAVLSTLVHEMVHLYQHHFGTPGRGRYHNREWADIMKRIGLQPTSTGEAGGKETGDSMSHLIVSNGLFEKAANILLGKGFAIGWAERVEAALRTGTEPGNNGQDDEGKKSGKRIKYYCAVCGLNVWARHGAEIDCHADKVLMLPV